MATARQWWMGARPRTLPAAIAPVAVGTGVAQFEGEWRPVRAALALIVALSLQLAVNYANDFSDGIRGTDDNRVGPTRLTAAGLAGPASVRAAAIASFGVAVAAGVALVWISGRPQLLIVGVCCIAAAWFYTGGKNPYGYRGFGEVSVFVFFGLAATVGTAYVQTLQLTLLAWVAAAGVGALACALLVVNNLRDVASDAEAGKLTLAVRLGEQRTRFGYVVLVTLSVTATVVVAVGWTEWALLSLPAFILAAPPLGAVMGGAGGTALLPVLRDTGRTQLAYGLLLGVGIALG